MKVKAKYVLPVVALAFAGVGVYTSFFLNPAKPDLYEYTDKALKTTSLFQPCLKEAPSLNIQIKDNDSILINGLSSKVTFVEKVKTPDTAVHCTGLDVRSSRLVYTASYSMVISESKNGFVISELKHIQNDEALPGTWFFKKST
ncbi:plasmid transfer protein [Photorhabdus tasmaniensis]